MWFCQVTKEIPDILNLGLLMLLLLRMDDSMPSVCRLSMEHATDLRQNTLLNRASITHCDCFRCPIEPENRIPSKLPFLRARVLTYNPITNIWLLLLKTISALNQCVHIISAEQSHLSSPPHPEYGYGAYPFTRVIPSFDSRQIPRNLLYFLHLPHFWRIYIVIEIFDCTQPINGLHLFQSKLPME